MDSTPSRKLLQNSSGFFAPGKRQDIPMMAISEPLYCSSVWFITYSLPANSEQLDLFFALEARRNQLVSLVLGRISLSIPFLESFLFLKPLSLKHPMTSAGDIGTRVISQFIFSPE